MAVPILSHEHKMIERLRRLRAAEYNFAQLVAGIVGKSRLAQAFKDSTKGLDRDIVAKLNEKLDQMEDLAAAVAPVPVDWTNIEAIRDALIVRLAAKIEIENDNHELDGIAAWATAKVSIKAAGE